jgi:hypothetical protein
VVITLDANSNPDSLILNPAYDGVTNDSIFKSNHILSNFTNGYVSFALSLRIRNLVPNKTYNNTAKALGQIGEGGIKVSVIDSSNNGSSSVIDPNHDGDPGDKGENVPTPYFFGLVLPIQIINVDAEHTEKNKNTISWTTGATQIPVSKF